MRSMYLKRVANDIKLEELMTLNMKEEITNDK